MEIWHFVVGLLALVTTIIGAIIGSTWRFAWQIASMQDVFLLRIDEKAKSLNDQLLAVNSSMLLRIDLAETALEKKLSDVVLKFDARTLEIERDLANFKAYCERQFMSKDTFNTVIAGQSSERNLMKSELIDRLNRIDNQLISLKLNNS